MARLKSNASTEAYEYIKNKINRFDLIPGDAVSDLALSQELDMSRTPIREAIQNLEQNGLVIKERTKYTVAPITKKDVKDIFIARIAIEKMAIECIILNNGLSAAEMVQIEAIEDKVKIMLDKGDFYHSFTEDELLHTKIVEFSNNTRLMEFKKMLAAQGERLRWLSILNAKTCEDTVKEHESIISYLEEKNLDKAIYFVEKHLYHTLNEYLNVLDDEFWLDKIIQLKKMN